MSDSLHSYAQFMSFRSVEVRQMYIALAGRLKVCPH